MKPVIIETERLQLREMELDNIEALATILQDDRVMYAYNGAFQRMKQWLGYRNSSGVMLTTDSAFGEYFSKTPER